MTVKEYIEEFFRLSIRTRQIQGDIERVARYINGLRYELQDEISLSNMNSVEDSYQVSSRVEENILRRHNQKNRGQSTARGKGSPNRGGKFHTCKDEAEGYSSQTPQRGGFMEAGLMLEEEEKIEK